MSFVFLHTSDIIQQLTVLGGGGDPNQGISSSGSIDSYNIVAAIFMGDPRFEAGAPYNVGMHTCVTSS